MAKHLAAAFLAILRSGIGNREKIKVKGIVPRIVFELNFSDPHIHNYSLIKLQIIGRKKI